MAGRRPTPDHLKLLTGSKNPINGAAPRVFCYRTVNAVPRLKEVDREAYAMEEWDATIPSLVDNGLLTRANLRIWGNYCLAHAAARHAEDDVFENGRYVTTPVFDKKGEQTGERRLPNPGIAQANAARHEMLRIAQEFGMTPAAATRVKANVADGKTDGFEEFEAPVEEDIATGEDKLN
jgi:P27 family predicted phage terminase small subunit